MTVTSTINKAVRRVPGWVLYIVGAAYAGWLFFLGLTGGLGVEPIEALEHAYGDVALKLIIAGLAVTPLRQWVGINLISWRRALGVTAFFFVLAHFLVWAVLDVQRLSAIWADILERPYVTIGMAGFLTLIPLAVTSNNWSVRKLGPIRWRKLHKLVYPAAVLGALHYVWLVKGLQFEPLIYLAITILLLATRFWPQRRRATA
ncbi:protein-methionine-sulfoxide reductase heme-binding subunit MsrQ [Gymnodinialimonas ceratoperidinii]|uniref:Protein-methionine-sulfoxide reductase heme-binding subunit MsrQ n=1 Tax=Gymnodinialimonas ceratoperidinii TaxID=2856823 RepID=A0A8F6TYU4_9RHOB|nr:protein-methionine-sulfoxide reductase heme-binding subunit MsrQ [Gymnodinialimonas ceratoperidinii]QXT40231.1 protein-methionine-sulfoxide reductase heme-binding subunit MsrQ [Gymnodinialimonas ceratoperidinii]